MQANMAGRCHTASLRHTLPPKSRERYTPASALIKTPESTKLSASDDMMVGAARCAGQRPVLL